MKTQIFLITTTQCCYNLNVVKSSTLVMVKVLLVIKAEKVLHLVLQSLLLGLLLE